MPFAGTAHRFREDVHLDRSKRAVGPRNRGGADERTLHDPVEIRGRTPAHPRVVTEFDGNHLIVVATDLQRRRLVANDFADDFLRLGARRAGGRQNKRERTRAQTTVDSIHFESS